MLFLDLSGYNYSRRRCKGVVEWFMCKHLPKHKIDLTVNHRGLLREGAYGWCTVLDSDYRPRAFEIEMHNGLNPDHYIMTLFHELWHVYQHVKGTLRDKGQKRLWKGIDCSSLDYEDQPWEIEASQMEQVLYDEYMNYLTEQSKSM